MERGRARKLYEMEKEEGETRKEKKRNEKKKKKKKDWGRKKQEGKSYQGKEEQTYARKVSLKCPVRCVCTVWENRKLAWEVMKACTGLLERTISIFSAQPIYHLSNLTIYLDRKAKDAEASETLLVK